MNLIISGIVVIDLSVLTTLEQSYEDLNRGTIHNMSDGSSVKIVPDYGEKLQTVITAGGWMPPGLDGLDYTAEIVIDCVKQRSISSLSNVITLPGIVRPDIAPEGFAIVDDKVAAVGSVYAAGVLTIDVTAGATAYLAAWLPRLTVLCDKPDQDKNIPGREYGWTLTGIEVNAA